MTVPRWLSELADSIPRLVRPAGEDTSLADFADLPPETELGWTPDVPSVLEEEPPPRVPIIPDPPRPTEYRDQTYWDGLQATLADEAVALLRHADDLFRYREDIDRAKKRRQKQVAKLRKQVAATPLPSQVTT